MRNNDHPKAIDPSKAGEYPTKVYSGGGYFYDEVLEYRVWVYTPDEGEYYYAFVDFESAFEFSKNTKYAQDPLVLILQKEYIDEPEEGVLIKIKKDRITEWQVEWLTDSIRDNKNLKDENPQIWR